MAHINPIWPNDGDPGWGDTLNANFNTVTNQINSHDDLLTAAPTTYAGLVSPAFTGTPTAPTAAGGTSSTQIATTSFVQTAVAGAGGSSSLASAADKVYYVSTAGSDSNTGRGWSNAFLTVAHALSVLTTSGTIYIGAGTYNESSLVINANQRLVGAGRDATIIQLASSGTLVYLVNQNDGALLNLRLQFASSSVTGTLLYLSNSFRFLIQSVKFRGQTAAGQIGVLLNANAGDSNFFDAHFTNLDIGVKDLTTVNYFHGGSWSNFLTTGYYAGDPTGATRVGGSTLQGITFLGSGASYINIAGQAATITVNNCWFDGAATTAIIVGASGTTYGPRLMVIRDCPNISGVTTSLLLNAVARCIVDGSTFGDTGSHPTPVSIPTPANVSNGYCGQNYNLQAATIASFFPTSWQYPVTGGSSSSVVNNYTATTDPTASSDNSAGYSVGSMWVNTSTSVAFQATSVGGGSAVWRRLTADVQIYTTPGSATWTRPAWATEVDVALVGGGGGGASGRRGASGTASSGGSGGAGGGYSSSSIPASACGSTESVQVGAGGAAGASQTTDATNGVSGANGSSSSFGIKVRATGGGGGTGGQSAAGSSGGTAGNGVANGGGGGASSSGAAGSFGFQGSGGAAGGGGGGGITTTPAFTAGGVGGISVTLASANATAGTTDGTAGAAGTSSVTNTAASGAGGAGGASSVTTAGGAGGAGGIYGAGGGGGGASLNGFGSGAGGSGANGIVVVISR